MPHSVLSSASGDGWGHEKTLQSHETQVFSQHTVATARALGVWGQEGWLMEPIFPGSCPGLQYDGLLCSGLVVGSAPRGLMQLDL